MHLEWSDDSGSENASVHSWRAIPEGTVIGDDGKITYGIEMEFLVPYIVKGHADPHPNDPRPPIELSEEESGFSYVPTDTVLKQIRGKIESALVGEEEAHMWSDDIQLMSSGVARDTEHKKWDLKEDSSVNESAFYGENPGYAGWVPVEIASRKFYSHSSNETARNERIIGQIARTIRWDIRCRINDTCGLHVHVGLEAALPEKLHGLKKLATVIWLAEDFLDQLYHPARREQNNPLNFYCRSLRCCSLLGVKRVEHLFDPTRPDDEFYVTYLKNIMDQNPVLAVRMSTLWKAKTTNELIQLLRPAPGILERLAYNFQSLYEHGTIEFRAMESTTNEELLKHWPYVCKQLTRIAKRHPEAEHGPKTESDLFRELVMELVDRPDDLDVFKFLKLIYVEENTIEFFRKKHQWDAESWEELMKIGSPRALKMGDYFQYRPSAPFFATRKMSEYGLNR